MENNRPNGGSKNCISKRAATKTTTSSTKEDDDDDAEFVLNKNSIQASIEKLNFTSDVEPNVMFASDSQLKNLVQAAKSKGFESCIIDKAFKTLKKPERLNEQEFIEYLQIIRSKYDLYETEPFESSKKASVKPAVVTQPPPSIPVPPPPLSTLSASKTSNIVAANKSSDPSSSNAATSSSTVSVSVSPPKNLPIEYVEMYETHDVFDVNKEKGNKMKRINTLVSAMHNDQKPMAKYQMEQLAKLANPATTSKKSSVSSNEKGSQESIEELGGVVASVAAPVKLPFLAYSDDPGNKSKKPRKTEPPPPQSTKPGVSSTTTAQICPEDLVTYRSGGLVSISSQESNQLALKGPAKGKGVKFSYQNQKRRGGDSLNSNKKMKRRSKSMNPSHLPQDKPQLAPPPQQQQPFALGQPNHNSKRTNFTNTQSKASTANNNNRELKFIVIDGSNVAREHGKSMGRVFSCRGIKLVVDFFLNRGHKQIVALVPRFRRGNFDHDCPTVNPEMLDELEERGFLAYTPSRVVDRRLILPYDDRFILKTALHYDAVIVSNDNYRDLTGENPDWKRIIHNNLLQYSFVGDLFMIADDPMGRRGPNIDEFLSIPTTNNNGNKQQNHQQQQMTTNNNGNSKSVSNIKFVSSVPSSLSTFNNNNNNTSGNKLFKGVSKQQQQLNQALMRTPTQSAALFNQLSTLFPNRERQITGLLALYPNHTDPDQFVSLLSS